MNQTPTPLMLSLSKHEPAPNTCPYVKDGINDYAVHGRQTAVNPAGTGSKVAAHHVLDVTAGGPRCYGFVPWTRPPSIPRVPSSTSIACSTSGGKRGTTFTAPDKWEFPWYAASDLTFHTLTLSAVAIDFAKAQLGLMLGPMYIHPATA